ncbi:MAG TPA: glycoside hydrolase family 2 TIM barrel-domain containing protein [Pirellulaceae bacterium]|nr:glycoside hydrolase family 2 TIM barrel-domain containing protein [Pirellulaceae bacterium]HMO91216.1 glycoside hydrolase family 2 TIM barrel-domain containing protein [Pirellulaceae bacterium]HMP70799.1 glycoside hydrolase family 2 TIM barrel-domain containing protein [Pirellulaceae bacterium]
MNHQPYRLTRTCPTQTVYAASLVWIVFLIYTFALSDNGIGQEIRLGPWQISLDGGESFQPIEVPGTVEDQIDVHFDGTSIYQTTIQPFQFREHQRVFIRFAGVATAARVYLNNTFVGEHLGAWTPFTIDLTTAIQQATDTNHDVRPTTPGDGWQLRVEVDEKVGHNTQGFLPVITHHFGGIWQPVRIWTSRTPNHLLADAARVEWLGTDRARIEVPVSGPTDADLRFAIRLRKQALPTSANSTRDVEMTSDQREWQAAQILTSSMNAIADRQLMACNQSVFAERLYSAEIELPFATEAWSNDSPHLYEFAIELMDDQSSASSFPTEDKNQTEVADHVILTSGRRTIDIQGDRFLLNDQPIIFRGLLNWGYSPRSVAPLLDEEWMRDEIEFARQRGFNLMKFCLWIPPKRYLELCDELGMMAWIEYPTWHPRLDGKHLDELRQEYTEFFQFDRNHPSVMLRSLTCETGPSAELAVIQALYDLCKQYVPGAIVVDDSSWISWNRVYDFFDDHPYGNNHTWVATLTRLRNYIAERDTKPLVLGEAIAADSWTVPNQGLLQLATESPAHGPWFVADNLRWTETMQQLAAHRSRKFSPDLLLPSSLHYGMLMRKYQIETYRREVPYGGYVVSVIRDFPKAAMGLIDFQEQPKQPPTDWKFQQDSMLLLETEQDRRSFFANQDVALVFQLATPGKSLSPESASISVSVQGPAAQPRAFEVNDVHLRDEYRASGTLEWLPPAVQRPQRLEIHAAYPVGESAIDPIENTWPVWVFPALPDHPYAGLHIHDSASELAELMNANDVRLNPRFSTELSHQHVVLTRRLDRELLSFMERGGKVWLVPDGSEGSLPVTDHWFLRGSVAALPGNEAWLNEFDADPSELGSFESFCRELQHFDLAGPVVSNMDHYLQRTDPLLLLWDNHDRRDVLTHGLVFSIDVGDAGHLFVSTLRLWGNTNAAGQWLGYQFFRQLVSSPAPLTALAERMDNLAQFKAELERKILALHHRTWRFQPDPSVHGKEHAWFAVDFDDDAWGSIRVDRHWEGQGYSDLDGWGWYRLTVEIPEDWIATKTYLNFTGIDDYADIFVNGELVGTAGNIETKQTAFDERLSFDISRFVGPGRQLQITVAVYDWFGAGGIFRPVTLSTEPLNEAPPILK